MNFLPKKEVFVKKVVPLTLYYNFVYFISAFFITYDSTLYNISIWITQTKKSQDMGSC